MDELERRLRDSLTQNLQSVGAFSLAPERMQRARRVRMVGVMAAVALALSLGTGTAVVSSSLFTNEGVRPAPGEADEQEAPVLAVVVCAEDGARVEQGHVRPQADGVHVVFRNEAGRRAFFVKPLGDEGSNEGGRLRPEGDTELTTAAPPGEMLIGCFDSDRDTPFADVGDPRYARVTVVDPEGLWVSQELPCGLETSESRMRTDSPADSDTDLPALARREVPGLRAEDVIREPGYPGTEWHLNAHVVLRDGEPVAHLAFAGTPRDTWEIAVRTCQGTEIGWRPFSRPDGTKKCEESPTYAPSMTPVSGAVGTRITVNGAVPVYDREGNYSATTRTITVWWNLSQIEWPSALSGDPVAAGDGGVLKLAEVDVADRCDYAVTFEVPTATAGTYPVILLQHGVDDKEASMLEPLTFEVTSP